MKSKESMSESRHTLLGTAAIADEEWRNAKVELSEIVRDKQLAATEAV